MVSIVLKSFFLNNWGVQSKRTTWLESERTANDTFSPQAPESNFLTPKTSDSSFLDSDTSDSTWLKPDGGTPDFSEEGEETYI
jgi:hypothetical protein